MPETTAKGGGRRRLRILLTRPDHLGDVLLTLPAASAIRRALPRATIAYLVREETAPLLALSPDVDEVTAAPFPPVTDAARRPPPGLVAEAVARLSGPYDAALVLRPDDPWSAAVVAAAGIPVRIGFDLPRTVPFLTDVLADDPPVTPAVWPSTSPELAPPPWAPLSPTTKTTRAPRRPPLSSPRPTTSRRPRTPSSGPASTPRRSCSIRGRGGTSRTGPSSAGASSPPCCGHVTAGVAR